MDSSNRARVEDALDTAAYFAIVAELSEAEFIAMAAKAYQDIVTGGDAS